uniref:Secreted protein n=1 Tax=Steinernema glaseri TaxID=37863 RepID=A0A1I8AM45_9BILA
MTSERARSNRFGFALAAVCLVITGTEGGVPATLFVTSAFPQVFAPSVRHFAAVETERGFSGRHLKLDSPEKGMTANLFYNYCLL